MITKTVLMTLQFALVIGLASAAFALVTGGASKADANGSYASLFYGNDDDAPDHDDDDD